MRRLEVCCHNPMNSQKLGQRHGDSFFHYDMQYAKGAKMPRGDKAAVLDYRIPLPPLEIQCEIVQILDNFANLTAELAKRKKQYEHYRDMLLNFTGGGQI